MSWSSCALPACTRAARRMGRRSLSLITRHRVTHAVTGSLVAGATRHSACLHRRMLRDTLQTLDSPLLRLQPLSSTSAHESSPRSAAVNLDCSPAAMSSPNGRRPKRVGLSSCFRGQFLAPACAVSLPWRCGSQALAWTYTLGSSQPRAPCVACKPALQARSTGLHSSLRLH